MPVVVADLRDARLRDQLRTAATGAVGDHLYAQLTGVEPGHLSDAPMRLVVLLPLDAELVSDAERLALALLGVDPHPRTIVGVLNGNDEAERDARDRERVLPSEFARSHDVRFLDLRSPKLSIAHPRSGAEQVGTGPRDPWVRWFVTDLVVQLRDRAVFDQVWTSIPRDRPATIGMRLATLGSGRERAVADLALRLAGDLRPDREPDMGRKLPDRAAIDPGLRADAPLEATTGVTVPKAVAGLARVRREPITKVLTRSPAAYNDAVREDLHVLDGRAEFLAGLFERASAPDDGDGPKVHPLGAVELDQALGGIVFGDAVARAWDEGEDAADRVGRLLSQAAERQADGLSAVILATWLRADADLVQPMGPARAAAILRDPSRPWASLHQHITGSAGVTVPTDPHAWVAAALKRTLRASPTPSNVTARPGVDEVEPDAEKADADADDRNSVSPTQPRAPSGSMKDPWRIPVGLSPILGSLVWRHRPLGFLFLLITTIVVSLAILQIWADTTGNYIVEAADLGIDATTLGIARLLLFAAGALLVAYALLSLAVAVAVRRWAEVHRFHEVPKVAGDLETEARRLAVTEVARCAIRREYARVARAAADSLERAAADGAAIAETFGRATENAALLRPPSETDDRSPHRRLLGGAEALTGTDAGGIYRIYPMYVQALRGLFAQALVEAIREKWPRVRGVFWSETAELVSSIASRTLEARLERVLEVGLQRGDLARNGVDPADDLAVRLWSDPVIRDGALEALQFAPDEPMPLLATPADNRLLDATADAPLILAIPPTLVPLLAETVERSNATLVVTDALETATAIRVFPFQPGLYDFREATAAVRQIAS